MIPDYKDLRSELEAEAIVYLQVKQRSTALLSKVRGFTQHEGTKHRYEQRGRGVRDGGFRQMRQEILFSPDEMTSLVGDALIAKLDEMANGLSQQLTEQMLNTVGQECDAVGNSINANGKPFSKDLFLDMIDRTETDFDEKKKPKQSFVLHPEAAKTLIPMAKQWETDPEFVKKHAEIMSRKFEEFRERESRRKLVD
jgi:hypothetical protein